MVEKRGLFIAYEGPDRVGKSLQSSRLSKYIKSLDKYADVLETHEPWKSEEIKAKLEEDKDILNDGHLMAELFIENRARHTQLLIRPVLKTGGIVISDRYKMSTCAYQWAQGVPLHDLLSLHQYRGILTPDITFCFEAPYEILLERGNKRIGESFKAESVSSADKEKFERDDIFAKKVLEAYRSLSHMAQVDNTIFGKVNVIDASKSVDEVFDQIKTSFDNLYSNWKSGKLPDIN
jgi:dTMP kinase